MAGKIREYLVLDTKDHDAKLKQAQASMRRYAQESKNVDQIIKTVTSGFTALTAKLGAAATASKVATDAFFASETNIDEWGRTVEGAKGAYDVFINSLNTGEWSNFFSNLNTAIAGARKLYDEFDRLGSIKTNNSIAINIAREQVENLRRMKAEGKDVDAQLKEAVANMERLERMSSDQGKAANKAGFMQVLQNRGISSAGAESLFGNVAQQGQQVFDTAAKRVAELEAKFGKTRTTTVGGGMYGGGTQVQQKYIDTDSMSAMELSDYTQMKALLDAETALKPYIEGYAGALQEASSVTRQNTRLMGSTGAAKTGKAGGTNISEQFGKSKLWDMGKEQYEDNLDAITDSELTDKFIEQQKAMMDASIFSEESAKQMSHLKYMDNLQETADMMDELNRKAEESQEKFYNMMDGLYGIAQGFGALGRAAGDAGKVFSTVSSAAMMAQAVAAFVKTLKSCVTPWDFIAAIGGGTASIIAAFASLPKFADGGIAYGPTLGLFGEYPGASNNPEVVAPLDKLRGMLNNDSGLTGDVRFRIAGRDLEGVLAKRNHQLSRS